MADRTIPEDLRVVCAEMAGHELLGGNLRIYPLESDDPDTLTVANASDRLRSWDWPVPDELVVFGDNGQGDSFGLWVPRDGGARPVVVQIGAVFEEACLAVVAEDLECFLRAWGTYYGLLLGEPAQVAGADRGARDSGGAQRLWTRTAATRSSTPCSPGRAPACPIRSRTRTSEASPPSR